MIKKLKRKYIEIQTPEMGRKVKSLVEKSNIDSREVNFINNRTNNGKYRFYYFDGESFKATYFERVENFTPITCRDLENILRPFPRKMLVSKDNKRFYERLVLTRIEKSEFNVGGYIYKYIPSNSKVIQGTDLNICRFAKEIDEVEEMTLEQVCKELGREIKIIK